MDGVRSWTGICAWESDWRREDPFLVLLVCLGLDLGHSAQQCLWGKASHVSLFVRGRREAQSFPSYPYQVYEVSNFNVISYLHSKWWEHVSLRDSLEPWVRWLHAGSMYPAQRPGLGRGGFLGLLQKQCKLCLLSSDFMVNHLIFFCWEIPLIPQSNWSTASQNNFPLNKECATTMKKK